MTWQREMPQRPGKYWTRTLDGEEAGIRTVCSSLVGMVCAENSLGNRLGLLVAGSSWGGWWWSEPLPEIPPWP